MEDSKFVIGMQLILGMGYLAHLIWVAPVLFLHWPLPDPKGYWAFGVGCIFGIGYTWHHFRSQKRRLR